MSRLTGTDALNLMEAYQAVYAPRELTEEQVWEEVESWVNSLVEEGYDLSDYTWDDLYEYYVSEAQSKGTSSPGTASSSVPVKSPKQTQVNSGRFVTPVRPGTTVGSTPTRPSTTTRQPSGAPVSRPTSPTTRQPTPSRPATTATRPTVSQTIPSYSGVTNIKPVGSPIPMNAVVPVASAPTQDTTVSVTPSKPSLRSGVEDLQKMRAASLMRQQGRTLPSGRTPTATDLKSHFDPFDVVIGHLIDEGYADTEDAALIIMSNMSEDWIQSIVEGLLGSGTGFLGSTAAELGAKGGHDVLPWNQNTRYTTTGRVRRPGENIRGERILNDPNRGATTMRMGGPVPPGARVSRQTPPPNPYLQGGKVGVSPAPVQRPRTPLVSRNVPKPTGGSGGSSGRASTNYGRGF